MGKTPRRLASSNFRPVLISASLIGSAAALVIVHQVGSRSAMLFAALIFVYLFVVFAAVWDDVYEEGRKAVGVPLGTPGRIPVAVSGAVLLLVSLLGLGTIPGPFNVPRPLLDFGWGGLPVILCIAGAVMISMPVVRIKSERVAVDAEVNAGYLVFFVSFLVYLAMTVYTILSYKAVTYVDGIRHWLLLISFSSCLVIVCVEALNKRRSGRKAPN
ncbi:MAG: hypothetical protein KKB90_03200 [Actinobacteria bacterium]|nr:hypothetical protein [Actinomycetota bacterium]MCG2817469.1 hypothetical protein [Actinomycetes bacterium]MBU4217952.1 hypothetical protein [Actinomycetota bacterium]MBU4357934.1 hypothetical protein [Actinomycetota bacterium]MBU4393015.1 hypothetical protein [Actinomycetota bacterium]